MQKEKKKNLLPQQTTRPEDTPSHPNKTDLRLITALQLEIAVITEREKKKSLTSRAGADRVSVSGGCAVRDRRAEEWTTFWSVARRELGLRVVHPPAANQRNNVDTEQGRGCCCCIGVARVDSLFKSHVAKLQGSGHGSFLRGRFRTVVYSPQCSFSLMLLNRQITYMRVWCRVITKFQFWNISDFFVFITLFFA